jgi:hypothetical protein
MSANPIVDLNGLSAKIASAKTYLMGHWERRTENGHDLRKEVVRVISTMPQVIHEGDAVIPLLVGVLEEEVGEPLQVHVVLEQRWCYEAKRPNLKLKAQPK